jgi:hypothetical protein
MVDIYRRDQLRGIEGIELHILPDAWLRKNYPDIIDLAFTRRIKIIDATKD